MNVLPFKIKHWYETPYIFTFDVYSTYIQINQGLHHELQAWVEVIPKFPVPKEMHIYLHYTKFKKRNLFPFPTYHITREFYPFKTCTILDEVFNVANEVVIREASVIEAEAFNA